MQKKKKMLASPLKKIMFHSKSGDQVFFYQQYVYKHHFCFKNSDLSVNCALKDRFLKLWKSKHFSYLFRFQYMLGYQFLTSSSQFQPAFYRQWETSGNISCYTAKFNLMGALLLTRTVRCCLSTFVSSPTFLNMWLSHRMNTIEES